MSSVSEPLRREDFRRALCVLRSSARRAVMSDILAEIQRLVVLAVMAS